MKPRIFLLLITGLFCSMTASGFDILLDTSASMLGFQKNGLSGNEFKKRCAKNDRSPSGESWIGFLSSLSSNVKNSYRFGDKGKFATINDIQLAKVCLVDNGTDLAGALLSWLEAPNSSNKLLIITDNVADTGSTDNQKKFTELISGKESKFSHVTVITVRLPFKGTVYSSNNSKKEYIGKRALVLYLLGKKSTDKTIQTNTEFNNFKGGIERKLQSYENMVFQVRPFSTKTVKQTIEAIKFTADESNKVSIKSLISKNGDSTIKISNYTLGQNLQFAFDTKLGIQGAFLLKDIELNADITFDELPDHITSQMEAINNESISFHATVSPSPVTLTPISKQTDGQVFHIEFQLNRFSLADMPFKNRLKYALNNTQDLYGQLDLKFNIEKEQYLPEERFFREWTHQNYKKLGDSSNDIQSKVYNLESILKSAVAETSTEENLKRIPLILQVRYNMGPVISSMLLALVLLGVMFWLWVKSRNSQDYVLTNDMGDQIPISIGLGQAYKHYDDRNRYLFSLRFFGFSYLVTSRYKISGSRLLSSGESFEIYDKETESEQSYYLSKAEDNSSYSSDSYDW